MNKTVAILVCLAGIITWTGCTKGKEQQEVSQPKTTVQATCPIMGGKINKSLYVDHDGKRIYVCCQGCVGKVKEDPAKYIKKLEAEGVTLEKVD